LRGRDVPLGQVLTAWESAVAARERRLVLVAGEPGIGKTRLAAVVAAEVAADGARVLHGWCDDGVGIAYEAWVHALGGFVQSADDEEILALAKFAPDLVRCISVVGERLPDVVPRPTTDAASDRARLFDAVDSLLARISVTSPVLLVLDDLHWADPATLGLLRWILSSERSGPVLVLGAYRDTDVDRRHPLSELLADLRRDPRVERVALRGLEEQAIGALLHDRAGHHAPREFVTALYGETDGNPFFAEEVVAHLVETGAIFQRDGEWTTDRALADLGLPEGIRDVVGRRLSRLSEATNDLLAVAAVVGREFDLSTVAVTAEVTPAVAAVAFEEATRPGLLREVPNAPGTLAFTHALVRQTLLEEIGAPRRAHLHWRIGEALAATGNAPRGAVARHLCEGVLAGDPLIAADAAMDAAEEAVTIGASNAAADFAHRALALVDDGALDAPELRCHAILVIGECRAWSQVGDLAAARGLVSEAGWLAVEHGWPGLAFRAAFTYGWLTGPGDVDPTAADLVRAVLDMGADDHWRAALVAIAARLELGDGDRSDHEGGIAVVEAAAAAAAADVDRFDPLGRMLIADARWELHFADADVDDRRLAHDVRVTADAVGGIWMLQAFDVALTASLRHGDRDDFDTVVAEFAAFAARSDLGLLHANVALIETAVALFDGRLADAERRALEALSNLAPGSNLAGSAVAQLGIAWSWSGRDDDLLNGLDAFAARSRSLRTLVELFAISVRARRGEHDPRFDRFAADDFESLPWDQYRLGTLAMAGAAAVGLRDMRAAGLLEAILEPYHGQFLILQAGHLVYDTADGLRGDLLTLLGRYDEAVACLEAAAALCEQARIAVHSIRTSHQLARALASRNGGGDRERAHTFAADALVRATELGMPHEAESAQAVLDTF
jgi:tetratricopeptide (TPR) repeat protein